ncbi:hypothetical protein [Nonomuraea aridisoli]|uniref:Uncharacterized protein n=1 Tax=Nonomuraea aridisoli TaxID=2070368 RepID=A0A2W2E5R0_9ACTN|nr:hypothetical protein [Nonomuraea aridisoli]PZG11999.1 hypothetical protein C1J01_34110 [Nonomuraea aridisoli]
MRMKTASLVGGLFATTALIFAFAPAASATASHDPRDGRHWGPGHHRVHPHWGYRGHHHRGHHHWGHRGHHHNWGHHGWRHHRGW